MASPDSAQSGFLLTVLAEELSARGWRPGTTEAGQVLWTKGRYIALPTSQAVTVEVRIEEAGGIDEY